MKAFDKLRGILGRDCDGKPIKCGDMAVFVPTNFKYKLHSELSGTVFRVTGTHFHEKYKETWLTTDLADDQSTIACAPEAMRVIRGDQGDWKDIEQSTGWKPSVKKGAPVAA